MVELPIFNSRALAKSHAVYNLLDPVDRQKYFHEKLGSQIDELKAYLDKGGGFIGYMLAKKQAGKSLYSKMIEEIIGPERFAHISIGDIVRDAHAEIETTEGEKALRAHLQKNYRGYLSIDDALEALKNRSQNKVSVPTEFLLVLLKRKISEIGHKALFIDGLPRTLDQISYSLYFRDLINFSSDPDFFVVIDVPMAIIDARMKQRVVCPLCQTSRNMLFSPTTFVRLDETTSEYYMLCDNTFCKGYGKARYVSKEGDAAGVESIAERLQQDQALIDKALSLQGIDKVVLRSGVPLSEAHVKLDDYEVQPMISYQGGKASEGSEVKLVVSDWVFKDDAGVDVCTMYGAAGAVAIFSQIYDVVIGKKS